MSGIKSLKRVVLGVLASALLLGPLAAGVNAQDDEEEAEAPDIALLEETLQTFILELSQVDFDGDGEPDVKLDGDGRPIFVPEGFPGARDIPKQSSPELLERIAGNLDTSNLAIGDESMLLGDCSGFAMSFDEDGTVQDIAIGLGSRDGGGTNGLVIDLFGDGYGQRAFAKGNTFKVYDRVIYFGTLPRSGQGAIEHNWEINSIVSIDRGGDPNPRGKNRNAGEVDIGAAIPTYARFSGVLPVDAKLTSENNLFCEGEGWVEFIGPFPLFTALGAAATLFFAGGVLGLLFNARPAYTWKA